MPTRTHGARAVRAIVRSATPRLRAVTIAAVAASTALTVAQAPAAGPNVIYNPSFASGLRGWRTVVVAKGRDPGYPHILALSTPREPLQKCDGAQRHHPFLQLNVPAGASGYVEQGIIVPVTPGRLTFRTWGQLERVNVTVSVTSGPFVHRLLSYAPPLLEASPSRCSGMRPLTESLNVTRYAGQAVGLRIQASSQGLNGAIADFDTFILAAR
jgi:hypothetical protein